MGRRRVSAKTAAALDGHAARLGRRRGQGYSDPGRAISRLETPDFVCLVGGAARAGPRSDFFLFCLRDPVG